LEDVREVAMMRLLAFFRKKASGNVAKDRLKLVLVSDRANCSPDIIESIKDDILSILSKYMEVETENIDIKIVQTKSDSNNGSVPALVASIPLKDMSKIHY